MWLPASVTSGPSSSVREAAYGQTDSHYINTTVMAHTFIIHYMLIISKQTVALSSLVSRQLLCAACCRLSSDSGVPGVIIPV